MGAVHETVGELMLVHIMDGVFCVIIGVGDRELQRIIMKLAA
jgi:hypothetical protein